MLIDKIDELNDTLYKAFGRLKENSDNINNPEHQSIIANNIMELYKLDYQLIRGGFENEDNLAAELEIRRTVRDNELKRRKKKLEPKVRRPWYFLFLIKKANRAEELTEREAEANSDLFLHGKEAAVKKLEKIIEAADKEDNVANRPKAFDEPATPAAASSILSAKK